MLRPYRSRLRRFPGTNQMQSERCLSRSFASPAIGGSRRMTRRASVATSHAAVERLQQFHARFQTTDPNVRRQRKSLRVPVGIVQITTEQHAIVGGAQPTAVLSRSFAAGCGRMKRFPWHGNERRQTIRTGAQLRYQCTKCGESLALGGSASLLRTGAS